MNKPRRKELERALAMIAEAKAIIEQCKDEEQEAFDNLPESIQCGQQGEKMEEMIYTMEEAYNSLDEIENNIQDEVIDA